MTSNTTPKIIPDPIANVMGVPPLEAIPPTKLEQPPTDGATANDLEYVRTNLYELIEGGRAVLGDLLVIAQQSPNVKVYEVAALMIKTMAQTSMNLAEFHEKKKTILGDSGPKTVNNTLVLTTKDYIKFIRDKGKGNSGETE